MHFEMSMHIIPFAQERTKSKFISYSDSHNKASSSVSESRLDGIAPSKKCPIKVVDVNKLLKSPNPDEKKMTSNHNVVHIVNENENVKKFAAQTRPNDLSLVTISHVLSCFKEMLPSNFDLSRLIPNEKLTSLIIRYLKLDNDGASHALVKDYLNIIIEATKATELKFGDYTKHPYLNIEDAALQAALAKVLPQDFSMVDVTNQVLHCLCLLLKIGVFSDGFHFLRTQIRKFTAEGQQFNQIMNQTSAREINSMSRTSSIKNSEVNTGNKFTVEGQQFNQIMNQTSAREIISMSRTSSIKNSEINKGKKLQIQKDLHWPPSNCKALKIKNWPPLNSKTLKIKNWPPLNCNSPPQQNQLELSKASINVDPEMCRPKHLQFTTKIKPKKRNTNTKSKDIFPLEGILTYLKIKKCSARDVLANFSLMFYLCRHLRIKSRQSNLQKIKAILNVIEAKNIDTSNFRQHKKEIDQLQYTPVQDFHAKASPLKDDIKLSSNPVVIVENITDFAKEQMLFMRKKSMSIKNDEYFRCNQMSHLAQSYSSEHVRKLTSDTYKEFRKIVMKRNGVKVWFQLKFSALDLGTGVFIKDFRNPALGWEKGAVKQMKGPFRFLIKLDRGVEKWCFPDQIRPYPKRSLNSTESRPQRPVKPKQLLDL